MGKQTAVEWLEKEFVKLESTIGVHGVMYELIEQAKEMEKQITPITPEALIELGFVKKLPFYELNIGDREFAVHSKDLTVYVEWNYTNATTIEDIKHLIRLFA